MKPARDPAYVSWVRRHACIVCGRGGAEAHHLEPNMARRGSDLRTIPLCRNHHREGPDAIHRIGKVAFQERFGQVWTALDDVVRALNVEYFGERAEAA